MQLLASCDGSTGFRRLPAAREIAFHSAYSQRQLLAHNSRHGAHCGRQLLGEERTSIDVTMERTEEAVEGALEGLTKAGITVHLRRW